MGNLHFGQHRLTWWGLLLTPLLSISLHVQAQVLPLQVGPINDFAAVLGGKPQRAPLHDAINRMQQQFGVSAVVLIAERNPFQTIEQFGTEIRSAWGIGQPHTTFVLFLKQDHSWALDIWFGSAVAHQISASSAQQLLNELATPVKRGRIASATLQALASLTQRLEAGPGSNAGGAVHMDWAGWAVIAGLSTLGLFGCLRWLRSFCPHCVRKLSFSGSFSAFCSSCGYRR